jgi:HlyD family secretion protein
MKKIFIIFIISCVFLTGCGSEEQVVQKAERNVTTQLIGTSNHSNIISLSGNIIPTETVKLSFEIPGTITDITVDEGDCVQAGQVISTLDTKDYNLKVKAAQAQYDAAKKQIDNEIPAKIAQAQSALDLTKATYDRLKALYDVGGISQSQMDEITTKLNVDTETLNTAISAKDVAETSLKQAEAALDLANSNIKSTTLTSPISGVILKKLNEPGENTAAGYPVVAIGSVDKVYIEVGVPDDSIDKIQKGMNVTAKVYGIDKDVTGTVEEIGQLSDTATRTFPVKILIDNTDKKLKAGMTCKADISLDSNERIFVPLASVIHLSSGEVVFVYNDEDKTVTQKKIKTGEIVNDKIEVTEGLNNGEILVTDGQFVLHDGDKVVEKERVK